MDYVLGMAPIGCAGGAGALVAANASGAGAPARLNLGRDVGERHGRKEHDQCRSEVLHAVLGAQV